MSVLPQYLLQPLTLNQIFNNGGYLAEENMSESSQGLTRRIEELQRKHDSLLIDVEFGGDREHILNELDRLKRDMRDIKKELANLKKPPLIIGTVKEQIPDGRVIVKSSTGPDFLVTAADYISKRDIRPGIRVAMNKQTLSIIRLLPESTDPNVMAAEIVEKPIVTYEDIGGLKDQIRDVKETIEDPLLYPEKYKRMGIEPPKGILLVGPPGTGKTLIAKAAAHHTNATFIRMVGSELVKKYIGEGARMVRELFAMAKHKAPAIIFIDEIDSVASKRFENATSGDREVQRTMMQFLAEFDGFDPLGDVKIMAATNRPELLDSALLRPGRFDRIIEVPIPDRDARKRIFEIHTSQMPISEDVDMDILAKKTEEASGADIKSITTEAGMFSLRNGKDEIGMDEFLYGIEKVLSDSPERKIKKQVMFA